MPACPAYPPIGKNELGRDRDDIALSSQHIRDAKLELAELRVECPDGVAKLQSAEITEIGLGDWLFICAGGFL
jgi:hypothetical protein